LTDAPRFFLTLPTCNPLWAAAGAAAGVDCVGVDIERRGKPARQAQIRDARINDHRLSDLVALRRAAAGATLWARLNPLYFGSGAEIAEALDAGAEALTLPQFTRASELEEFRALVAGRARIIPLLEDAAALDDLDAVLTATDDVLMVGLNDLARSLGLVHPLQLAISPILDQIGAAARAAGVRWGFGGVADPAPRPDLPVAPDDLLSRYADTGAQAAWLSRSMIAATRPADLPARVAALRARIGYWQTADPEARRAAKDRVAAQLATALRSTT
jgi:2-keto-3-deoxy-L-rhamnonate aldolase RhmA